MSHYLVLVNLSARNKATGMKIIGNLSATAGEAVKPLWFDEAYFGVPLSHPGPARAIWAEAVKGISETNDLLDMLIVELGGDWIGRRDAKATNWLMTHLGPPRLE